MSVLENIKISPDLNKSKIAIVCIGYNRLDSMNCLLQSLLEAKYPFSKDIPLIISIDCSNNQQLYEYVQGFDWPYGEKIVNIESSRLGLKNHIFKCAGYSHYFKAVIILEDDSFVSPYFYNYVDNVLSSYIDENDVAGISLYANNNNEYVNIPFMPLNSGSDVYLLQDVQTRGECFTETMWDGFLSWYSVNSERNFENVSMPESIKKWTKAWSKYYYAYIIESRKYFLYPYVSFVTNMGAVGEHASSICNIVQVPLEYGLKQYNFKPIDELSKYDCFYCNEIIYNCLNLSPKDLCLDLYGFNPNVLRKKYLLSCKCLNYKVEKKYGLVMYPIEVNIIRNIEGNNIFLYDTSVHETFSGGNRFQTLDYIYCKHNVNLMLKYLFIWFKVHSRIKLLKIFNL